MGEGWGLVNKGRASIFDILEAPQLNNSVRTSGCQNEATWRNFHIYEISFV